MSYPYPNLSGWCRFADKIVYVKLEKSTNYQIFLRKWAAIEDSRITQKHYRMYLEIHTAFVKKAKDIKF